MSNIFFINIVRCFGMSFSLEDSFGTFMKKLRGHNLFITAFDIQEDIIRVYEKKGLSREQVFELKLGDIWHLIRDLKIEKKGLSREQGFELRLRDIWHLIGDLKIKKRRHTQHISRK